MVAGLSGCTGAWGSALPFCSVAGNAVRFWGWGMRGGYAGASGGRPMMSGIAVRSGSFKGKPGATHTFALILLKRVG